MTIKNAATGELVDDGEGVANVAEGFPFPILDADPAKAGMEAIWNHKLKYKGVSFARWNNQVTPTSGGQYVLERFREEGLGLYYKPGNTLKDINNILLYFFEDVVSPPRLAGQVLLVHETLDSKTEPRQAWVYNPGQRRVRRAPNVAYDNPGTASDGLRTNDMTDMFNGAMDRYDWKLVGKREMYVPYNDYKAHSDQTKVDDLIKPGFINPDLLRYELHRMYVVEANIKSGARHINPRRTFYLDEDSWQILDDRSLRRAAEAVALFRGAVGELLRSAGVLVDARSPLRPEVGTLSRARSGQPGRDVRFFVPDHAGHVLAAVAAPTRHPVIAVCR